MRLFISFLFSFFFLSATAQVAVKETQNNVYFFSPESVKIVTKGWGEQIVPVKHVKTSMFNVKYVTGGVTYILPKKKNYFFLRSYSGEILKASQEGFEVVSGD